MLISGKWSFVGSKAGVGEGKYEVEIAGEVREEVGVGVEGGWWRRRKRKRLRRRWRRRRVEVVVVLVLEEEEKDKDKEKRRRKEKK